MKFLILIIIASLYAASIQAESNDSLDVLKDAERKVQSKIEEFSRIDRYEVLLQAQKMASSLNPRGGNAALSPLDGGSLRLQLKVLLALDKARDPNFDPAAHENIVFAQVIPPLNDSDGSPPPAGTNPNRIKDPKARKAYEDAIAVNLRRMEKVERELNLSRGLDYAVLDIWIFVRGFAVDSVARKTAFDLINETLTDKALNSRIRSETRPGI